MAGVTLGMCKRWIKETLQQRTRSSLFRPQSTYAANFIDLLEACFTFKAGKHLECFKHDCSPRVRLH